MTDPMGQPHDLSDRDPIEHVLVQVSQGLACLGTIGFIALVAMSIVSIVSRKIGFGSVAGDIELMQAGTAVFAAAFLPYCSLLGEHLKVEFFTENASEPVKRTLDGLGDLAMTVVFAVLTWRTVLYAGACRESGEVSALVSLPLWWPVALMVPSLTLASLAAAYRTCRAFGLVRSPALHPLKGTTP